MFLGGDDENCTQLFLTSCGVLLLTAKSGLTQAIVGQELTTVTPVGNQFNITGGVPAGNNLFHSFGQFGLDASQTANFQVVGLINNVFARITGGSPSIINGTVQSRVYPTPICTS
ncbi:MAG: filamentous hemagglutinin N-terminal domain-containing protein [Alkalinema sp. RL_2_19]|nr:filamentous hemagglutinin N-terminal domain-containing protein [Alkalinema sp. RL_2_19]